MTTQTGLSHSAIHGHVDPAQFYPSPAHEEALARLHYVVEQHLRLGVLLGQSGSGKSMLLAKLAGDLASADRQVARASLLSISAQELLIELGTQLHANPKPGATPLALWRTLTETFKQNKYQQHTTVILLDDVHEATAETLAAVCRLADTDACEEARLTIVAAAETGELSKLPRRLLDRAALRVDVEPWEKEDTLGFLTQAVEQLRAFDTDENDAGIIPSEIFTPEAIDTLHELSGGIPRRVGQLAQWALLAGAGTGLEQVDDETVTTAAEELGVQALI